jgi:hypothetical protein
MNWKRVEQLVCDHKHGRNDGRVQLALAVFLLLFLLLECLKLLKLLRKRVPVHSLEVRVPSNTESLFFAHKPIKSFLFGFQVVTQKHIEFLLD